MYTIPPILGGGEESHRFRYVHEKKNVFKKLNIFWSSPFQNNKTKLKMIFEVALEKKAQ